MSFKESFICAIGILFVVLFIFFMGYLICSSETRGALYLNKDGKIGFVCNGVLKKYSEHTLNFSFVCDDGTTIENLTNFTLKAVE